MYDPLLLNSVRKPAILFCVGWAIVMLSLTLSIPPVWNTFIHSWRVEFVASIFLSLMLLGVYFVCRDENFSFRIDEHETKFIVLPIIAFICWSALSAFWAPSWRSAIHHATIWSEYLIFFLIVRYFLERGRNYAVLIRLATGALAFFAVLAVFGYCSYLIFNSGTSLGIVYAKYGEQVNTIFPLVLIGTLRVNAKKYAIGVFSLSLLWLLVFCSLSRTNLFLFLIGTLSIGSLVFLVRRFRRYRLKFVLVCAALILSSSLLLTFSFFSAEQSVPLVGRVSDSVGISSSNNFRKLMMSVGLEMITEHPIVGIGADNFGFEVNKYRAKYAATNPDDPDLAEAEDTIPERAHNEYLQITAEIGIVGITIFLWFLAGIAIMVFRAWRSGQKLSLYAYASILGLALFLASSLVTSYSFRLIQNGFVFFFVLAVASGRLVRKTKPPATAEASFDDEIKTRGSWSQAFGGSHAIILAGRRLKLACVAGILTSLVLTVYCGIRVTSVIYEAKANQTMDLAKATPLYEAAMKLDSENPEARYFLGLRLVDKGQYREAIPYLRESIRIGKAPSADFSYLASAQTLSGDYIEAEQTFAEAAALYPRSPFVLTRYAALLKLNGKEKEAESHLERAKQINLKQANTWWAMISESPQAATDLALWHHEYVPLMDLQPQTAMYAVKAEREIRHPEEKFSFGTLSDLATFH